MTFECALPDYFQNLLDKLKWKSVNEIT
jgi:hypothetical protein